VSTFSSSSPLYFSFNNILYKAVPTQDVTNLVRVLVLMNVKCSFLPSLHIILHFLRNRSKWSSQFVPSTTFRHFVSHEVSISQYHTKLHNKCGISLVYYLKFVGWDSSVGIATCCGPEVSGNISRWGEILCTRPTGPGVYPTSYTTGTGSFMGVQRPRLGVHHSLPFRADVKGKVELYIYSQFWSSWPLLEWTVP
jgi:hypothetical protein